jgi:hypothetical protein
VSQPAGKARRAQSILRCADCGEDKLPADYYPSDLYTCRACVRARNRGPALLRWVLQRVAAGHPIPKLRR